MSVDSSDRSPETAKHKQFTSAQAFGDGGTLNAFEESRHLFNSRSQSSSGLHDLEIVHHAGAAAPTKADAGKNVGPAKDSATLQAGAPDKKPSRDDRTTPRNPESGELDRASKPDDTVNFDKLANDLKTAKPGERQKIFADGLAQYQKSHNEPTTALDFSANLNGALKGSGMKADYDGAYGTHDGYGAVRLTDERSKTTHNPLGIVATGFAGMDQAHTAAFQMAQQMTQKINSFLDTFPPGQRDRARVALENQLGRAGRPLVDDVPDGFTKGVHKRIQDFAGDIVTQFKAARSQMPVDSAVHWFNYTQTTSGVWLPDHLADP